MASIHLLRAADKPDLPVLADGIQKTEEIWTDDFKGTAEDLVAAGIVEMHQLPGQPGRGKTRVSYKPDGTAIEKGSKRHGDKAGFKSVTRAGKTRYIVSVNVARDEGERRLELRNSQINGNQRAREAQEHLDKTLSQMPKTADDFRELLIDSMTSEYGPLGLLRKAAFGDGYPICNVGFTFDANARRELEALCARMVVLARNGGVDQDLQQRDAFIAKKEQIASIKGAQKRRPTPQLKVVWSASQ